GRHTRFSRDWSSDVCSSDLVATKHDLDQLATVVNLRIDNLELRTEHRFDSVDQRFDAMEQRFDERFTAMDRRFDAMDRRFDAMRSEERRVGKEGRWPWWAWQ